MATFRTKLQERDSLPFSFFHNEVTLTLHNYTTTISTAISKRNLIRKEIATSSNNTPKTAKTTNESQGHLTRRDRTTTNGFTHMVKSHCSWNLRHWITSFSQQFHEMYLLLFNYHFLKLGPYVCKGTKNRRRLFSPVIKFEVTSLRPLTWELLHCLEIFLWYQKGLTCTSHLEKEMTTCSEQPEDSWSGRFLVRQAAFLV